MLKSKDEYGKFADKDEALAFIGTLPWGNAAGCCNSEREVRRYSQVGMSHVTYGSIMPHQWGGNLGDNFWFDPETGDTINALGIPSRDPEKNFEELPRLREIANSNGSQFWVSFSGRANEPFDPNDCYLMARELRKRKCADGIEWNASCGNQELNGKRNAVICWDFNLFREGLAAFIEGAAELPTKIKFAPINDPFLLEQRIEVCAEKNVDWVVFSNTFANGYLERAPGIPAIDVGRGGLGGDWMRPITYGITQTVVPMLKNTSTRLISCGGLSTGSHVYSCLKFGAHAWAFNSVISRNNYDPKVVVEMIYGDESRGLLGLVDLLVQHGLPD